MYLVNLSDIAGKSAGSSITGEELAAAGITADELDAFITRYAPERRTTWPVDVAQKPRNPQHHP
jgi:hypothetical protein